MTAGESQPEENSSLIIKQLREITGIQDNRLLQQALQVSNGDINQAVSFLTNESARDPSQGTVADEPDNEHCDQSRAIDLTGDEKEKDDLQKAIALSLEENQKVQKATEDQDSGQLNDTGSESKAGLKRKRCEAWGDSPNPNDRLREGDWPVGLKNVGNTCWFSAVIQSLFQLTEFRRLVLNYTVPENHHENCRSHTEQRNLAFMQELRCLFALMVGSKRKYVDPSNAVELLKDAFRSSEAQQDVSEFTHKLLDWLEDSFQMTANVKNSQAKPVNPMVELFYGTYLAEGLHDGKMFSNVETFGQYPLQVNGFRDLHECLEGAMVVGEIETLHSDQSVRSAHENWFTKLPPVLTFELSRFEFNQSLGRPEKIHKKLEFPQVIYLDRYLHANKEHTRARREEVKRLKEQVTILQQRLERYMNYGSGPQKFPLTDLLQYVWEFASTKPSCVPLAQDVKVPLPLSPNPQPNTTAASTVQTSPTELIAPETASLPSTPQPQRATVHKPFTQSRPPVEMTSHPAPQHVTEQELVSLEICLQRWRAEVEQDMKDLKDNIAAIHQSIEQMYTSSALSQVPYRLHAVLVHEGQASAGHYWAYVRSHPCGAWLKYNDVSVTESSWEELQRDSYGGSRNASAYCLMYINDSLPHLIADDTDAETGQVLLALSSLPVDLRRSVREDNLRLSQEVDEWEEEQARKIPQKETVSPGQELKPSATEAQSPMTQSPPAGSQPVTRCVSADHSLMVREQTAQAIEKAATARQNGGAEATLKEAFHEEYSRLFDLAKEEPTPQNDPRLQHALVYFFQNRASKRVIERTLLEQFADKNLSYDERSISIMKVAQAKLKLIGPSDMDMEEYKKWHEHYSLFRKVSVYLLTGLECYQNGKCREALTYLVHAYQSNRKLLKNGKKRGVDETLIAHYRRKCLLELNGNAASLFESGEEAEVAEALSIMSDLVIPCMHLIATSEISKEDLVAVEMMRNHWCSYLGADIDARLQEKLTEFLPKLLDCSVEVRILREPPRIRPNSPHDLCNRFAAVMESIHGNSPVTVT
ncbi:ubiquitin carboxyl-terminal hydrolase 28 isoform X4 [Callorhinchus milii]|nr:ubiquitin carboxyl-terminal hydrolase 28 isoform X4 [Callorhinchus milii]